MATWIGLIVVGLLIGCLHAEQAALQEQLSLDSDDVATQVKALQQNVTELWTYIYRLRQAVEVHLTDLTRRQSRMERTIQHFGGHDAHGHGHDIGDHSHRESSHHHEPLTSSSDHHDDHSSADHHHDDHGSSDHHHDDHGSSDHHHDDHGSSDHHHDDHGSSDHHHDDHGSSDQHHDDHHHDSHGDGGDHHHDSHGEAGDHRHDSHGEAGDHHHTDDHHSDYHDEHHHGHHSTSESHSHTDDHSSHNDSDHSKEHGQDDHHHHHGDDSPSADDQQTTQDIEKPFTVTVVRSHHRDHHVETQDKTAPQNMSDPLNLLGGHSHHHHHHHHRSHQDQSQQAYDTKVTIPKYSDYRQYTFATCDVQPNTVISAELQQEVKGQVSFWQKKTGGPLNIHVRLRGFAIGDHHGHQQQQEQTNEAPLHGAGHRHGFHVHEFADLSAGCQSTGPHYNPFAVNHGGPKSSERHVGDLGNIECDDHGVTNIVFADPVASLTGSYSIVGRALVIHSDVDDYGVNRDDPESLKTGNAGTRIACCIIQNAQKLPLATYKAIKLASNHQP